MAQDKSRRLDSAGWMDVLRRYEAFDGSVRAFCDREGLNEASFYRWRARLRQDRAVVPAQATSPAPREAAGFFDLGGLLSPGGPAAAGGALELRLDLGGGVVLSLSRR